MPWKSIGIVASIISMFSGFCAIFLFFRVRKLFTLLTEEQMEEAAPIVKKQYRRIKIFLFVCLLLGVTGLILLFI